MDVADTRRDVASFLAILFYFTKSDIKTTLIPITIFAAAAAPLKCTAKLPHVVFWIWLHLLQFDVSNQTLDQDEDAWNKADRPIPSGRMTIGRARVLRWTLVPICFLLSFSYSVEVLEASASLVFFTVLYNEFRAHAGHWLVRNLVNAAGFMSFELGATLVFGQDTDVIDSTAKLAILLSGGIFATTIHAQDFKDTEGDRRIGRQTIPLVMGPFSRFTIIVPLVLWSIGLSQIWQLETVVTVAFVSLAAVVGGRFLLFRSHSADQVSFYVYNVKPTLSFFLARDQVLTQATQQVWLSAAHALPAYWRHKSNACSGSNQCERLMGE